MIYSPGVAILCAAAMVDIENFLQTHGLQAKTITAVATGIILAALLQGLMAMRVFSFDHFPLAVSTAIREHTTAQDKLVVINGGWGGDELIRSGRKGLSLWTAQPFKNADSYARLKQLGFDKLVILSESPFQNAIEIVNPGQTGIPRVMAKSYLTPQVEKWPTVYATDDIIIKDIP